MSTYVTRYMEVKIDGKWVLSKAIDSENKDSLYIMDNLPNLKFYLLNPYRTISSIGIPLDSSEELKKELQEVEESTTIHCITLEDLEKLYETQKQYFIEFLKEHYLEADYSTKKSMEELIREIHYSLSWENLTNLDSLDSYLNDLRSISEFIGECYARASLTAWDNEDYRIIYYIN